MVSCGLFTLAQKTGHIPNCIVPDLSGETTRPTLTRSGTWQKTHHSRSAETPSITNPADIWRGRGHFVPRIQLNPTTETEFRRQLRKSTDDVTGPTGATWIPGLPHPPLVFPPMIIAQRSAVGDCFFQFRSSDRASYVRRGVWGFYSILIYIRWTRSLFIPLPYPGMYTCTLAVGSMVIPQSQGCRTAALGPFSSSEAHGIRAALFIPRSRSVLQILCDSEYFAIPS
jgi:hypothetical protein